MTAPLFFADAEKLRAATIGDVVLLDGPEGRHAAKVRRLTVGEKLDLADGDGLLCSAEVAAVTGQAIEARVFTRVEIPPPQPLLTVVQALAKGDRDEHAVETMTEVGVDTIVPWQAGRSIVRWDPARAAKGIERWRATAKEAAKQARRPRIPKIAEMEGLQQIVARLASPSAIGVVLHEEAERPLTELTAGGEEIVLIVGPEGGISPDELAAFEAAGAKAYRLGQTVLRTSTAGTVAAAVVLAGSGRWNASTER